MLRLDSVAMYKLEILHNKTRLLLAPLKGTATVTVLVLVKVGSRYEPAQLNGISHFIEHLLFKGTKKRPTSLDITKELDGVGADFNAFTGKDHTGYYIKTNQENLELALDVVSDMLFSSVFSETEIKKEVGVIIEEINMYEDNPVMMVDHVFDEAVFQGSSLANYIAGPKKNIRSITRHDILNFFEANYSNDNVIVAIGGSFQETETIRLVNKYFKKREPHFDKSQYLPYQSSQESPRVKLITKATEQVHLALGYPAYNITDPRYYPLTLLAIILGGNMSSRLFLEIREKLGLAYYIHSAVSVYEDTGSLAIYAGLEKSNIHLAIKIIIKELEQLVSRKAGPEEIKRAKEFIKGKLILKLEDGAQLVQWLATQLLLKNKVETLGEQIKKIERVTAAEIQQAASDVIRHSRLNLGMIGPYDDTNKILNILH